MQQSTKGSLLECSLLYTWTKGCAGTHEVGRRLNEPVTVKDKEEPMLCGSSPGDKTVAVLRMRPARPGEEQGGDHDKAKRYDSNEGGCHRGCMRRDGRVHSPAGMQEHRRL